MVLRLLALIASLLAAYAAAYHSSSSASTICNGPRLGCDVCGPLFSAPLNTAFTGNARAHRGLLRSVEIDSALLGSDDEPVDTYYADAIDMSKEGLAWLDEPGLMWEAAKKDAAEKELSAEEYMKHIVTNIENFFISGRVHDRKRLLEKLSVSFFRKGKFTLLLGGKSVGKSLVLKSMAKDYNKAKPKDGPNLLVLYVNARRSPGDLTTGLANGVASLALQQVIGRVEEKDWVPLIRKTTREGLKALFEGFLAKNKLGVSEEILNSTRNTLASIADTLLSDSPAAPKSLLDQFTDIAKQNSAFPVLIIDEANVVLGNEPSDASTKNLLIDIVSRTKETNEMTVILASSEHAYPYRLEREGLNLQDVTELIFAEEIPPRDMWMLLANATYDQPPKSGQPIVGMGPRLSELCLAAYGGHLLRVRNAMDKLSSDKDTFKASALLPDLRANIVKCLQMHCDARPLLEAMAKFGFAPLTTPDNPTVEMIVKLNIGGVVTEKAATIGVSMRKWVETENTHALIPSSESLRLEIARTLHAVPASDDGKFCGKGIGGLGLG